jgi:hypothetical protein
LKKLLSVPARPQSATAEGPMACQSMGPPCGSMCRRYRSG